VVNSPRYERRDVSGCALGSGSRSARARAGDRRHRLEVGAWCIRRLTPLDHKLLSRSNGRLTIFGPLGVPLLLLTTTGRKTGQRRQIPLTYMREGDRLFLVGATLGRRTIPHGHRTCWLTRTRG
jgi:F420H(2)-dependent quinone reductase